jgi:hypothetical protein
MHGADPYGDPIAYSATGLPLGLTIDPATGLITGGIPFNISAAYNARVTATVGSLSTTQTFVWTIRRNRAPVFTDPGSQAINEGLAIQLQLIATDPDSDPLTFRLSQGVLPRGLTLDANGLITGVATDARDTLTTTIVVADRWGVEASRSFTWRINHQPLIDAVPDQRTTVSRAVRIDVGVDDPTPGRLTIAVAGLPPGVTSQQNSQGARISGTPTTIGTYTVSITATDALGAVATRSFSWEVTAATR